MPGRLRVTAHGVTAHGIGTGHLCHSSLRQNLLFVKLRKDFLREPLSLDQRS
jgi:hypothetical protein